MPKYIFKKNNDVLSYCQCDGEPAMSTGQLDCPWCGCGWMMSCSKCGKAFVFGEVRETDVSIAELAKRELISRGMVDAVSPEEMKEGAEGMEEAFESFSIGETIVYLDGDYFALNATNIEFEGYFARHNLSRLPHHEALSDPDMLIRKLGDPSYWTDRELQDRE